MDVDPEGDNGLDAGIIEEEEDIYDPHMSDVEDEEEHPVRPGQSKRRRRKAKDSTVDDEAQDNATPSRLHSRDPGNFLKLCAALKTLTSREIMADELEKADSLIRAYSLELVEVQ